MLFKQAIPSLLEMTIEWRTNRYGVMHPGERSVMHICHSTYFTSYQLCASGVKIFPPFFNISTQMLWSLIHISTCESVLGTTRNKGSRKDLEVLLAHVALEAIKLWWLLMRDFHFPLGSGGN